MNNAQFFFVYLIFAVGLTCMMAGFIESRPPAMERTPPTPEYPVHNDVKFVSDLDLFLAAPRATLIDFDAVAAMDVDKLLGPVYRAVKRKECDQCDIYEEGPFGELGHLQITPIIVRDVNEYLKQDIYTLEDRLNIWESTEMFIYYYKRYTYRPDEVNAEHIARRWNGGPTGHRKSATLVYWQTVASFMLEELDRD